MELESSDWRRITLTHKLERFKTEYGYYDDNWTWYAYDGANETVRKQSMIPLYHEGFSLFFSPDKSYRLKSPARVRLITIKRTAMPAQLVAKAADTINSDLPPQTLRQKLQERLIRKELTLLQLVREQLQLVLVRWLQLHCSFPAVRLQVGMISLFHQLRTT